MRKRTGVLIHSIHLQVPGRKEIMWGRPPDQFGRIPLGIKAALEEEAEILILGNGLRSGVNGEMESEFNYQDILDNFDGLSEFAEFQGIDLTKARERILQILVLDRVSLNTSDEVSFAGRVFETAGIEKVIGVSSRTHATRCFNDVLIYYSRPDSKIAVHNVSTQACDTGWAPNSEVVVHEPPHRPDDLMGELRLRIAKMLFNHRNLLEIKKALGL